MLTSAQKGSNMSPWLFLLKNYYEWYLSYLILELNIRSWTSKLLISVPTSAFSLPLTHCDGKRLLSEAIRDSVVEAIIVIVMAWHSHDWSQWPACDQNQARNRAYGTRKYAHQPRTNIQGLSHLGTPSLPQSKWPPSAKMAAILIAANLMSH